MKIIFYALIFYFMSAPAHADFILHSWQDHHEKKTSYKFQLNESYYLTSGNYDGGGSSFIPSGFQNHTRIQTDLVIDFGLADSLTLFARITWAYMSINSSIRPGVGYSFGDQTFGSNFRIFEYRAKTQTPHSPPIFIDLQLQGDFPAYSTATTELNLTPYPGDGTIDITGGMIGSVPIFITKQESLAAIAGGGYTFRTASFSSAIPWVAGLQYSPYEDGISATLAVTGLTSLKTDPNASGPIRPSAGGGGSFYIGGTNPSSITVRGSVGYKLEANIELQLYGAQTIWGQAAPFGFNLGAAFQTRWGGAHKSPVYLTPKSYGHANQGFINYSLDARVIISNDRLNLVKIDKGTQDGIEVGQLFDFFLAKQDGSQGEAVARGQVINVKPDGSALEITEFFRETLIQEGFIAKRVIQ